MDGTGAVSLYTAFGTPHRGSGFGHVQFFPVTQDKRFALTRGQPHQRLFDHSHNLRLLVLPRGIFRGVRVRFRVQSFERVEILVFFVATAERREEGRPRIPDLRAAEMVVDRILLDALKQHRQLGRGLPGVLFRQFQHGVLHDVERRMLVPRGEHRLLERTALHFREKSRNFLMGGQFALPLGDLRRL